MRAGSCDRGIDQLLGQYVTMVVATQGCMGENSEPWDFVPSWQMRFSTSGDETGGTKRIPPLPSFTEATRGHAQVCR
jgi:hypothetical protein